MYNYILKTEDIVGGAPVVWSEVVDFSACVHNYGLMKFTTLGNKYT